MLHDRSLRKGRDGSPPTERDRVRNGPVTRELKDFLRFDISLPR